MNNIRARETMGSYFSASVDDGDDWKSDAHYAMEGGRGCVICGGPFDLQGEVYNIDPKDPRYQWLFNYRLLGRSGSEVDHKVTNELSEPINTSGIDGVFLSEKCWLRGVDSEFFCVHSKSGSASVWLDALLYPTDISFGTLFPLHEACIMTGCRVIKHKISRHGKLREQPPLAILCNILNSVWLRNLGDIDPNGDSAVRNDIFRLSSCSSIYGPRSVLALSQLEWWGGEYERFYANPLSVPEGLSTFVFNVLLASSNMESDHVYNLAITRDPTGIERLPAEILNLICSYMPVRSVIALHCTSKAFALKAPLGNVFWRDRLRDGSLHPHIWDLDTNHIEQLRQKSNITFSAEGWDWKSVAKLLAIKQFPIIARDQRLDDLPFGLWNRCRIWNIIEEQEIPSIDALWTDRADSVMAAAEKSM